MVQDLKKYGLHDIFIIYYVYMYIVNLILILLLCLITKMIFKILNVHHTLVDLQSYGSILFSNKFVLSFVENKISLKCLFYNMCYFKTYSNLYSFFASQVFYFV